MNSVSSVSETAQIPRYARVGLLLDLYGALLTERQRSFVQLHFNEDHSFGEIAREHSVSRQAVHDAVKHAENALESYESKLHLLEAGLPYLLKTVGDTPLPDGDGASDEMEEETQIHATQPIAQEALAHLIPSGASAPPTEPSSSDPDASDLKDLGKALASPQDHSVLRGVLKGLEAIQQKIQRSGGIIYDTDGLAKEIRSLHTQVCEALGEDV